MVKIYRDYVSSFKRLCFESDCDRVGEDAEADDDPGEPLPEDAEERYGGTYDLGQLLITIFMEEGRMMGQVTGQGAFPLAYRGDDVFGADFDPTLELIFRLDEDGRAEHLTLRQQEMEFQEEREE